MAKLYVMCGISGSGKTTYSKEFAKRHNLKYIGVDDYYALINGDECIHKNTFDVWISIFKELHDAEMNNVDCMVDTNCLTYSQRMQFIEWFPTFEHHIIYIEADTELRTKNNLCRRRQVPDDTMYKMALKLEVPVPTLDADWDSIVHIINRDNSFSKPIILKGSFVDGE